VVVPRAHSKIRINSFVFTRRKIAGRFFETSGRDCGRASGTDAQQ
jgi:hypothetical protein